MTDLTIWAYNVKFGDALLIRVPDRDPATGVETLRHILIDVGNAQAGEGGEDAVFGPILRDIRSRLDGRPVDLYVMTHEHLDHVQGLPYGATREGIELDVDYSWLSGSAAPDYYERHPDAKRQLTAMRSYLALAEKRLAAAPESVPGGVLTAVANNNPRKTADCVEYLRGLAAKRTVYVHRSLRLRPGTHHSFREAKLRILAPEEDTATYYGRFRPSPLGAAGAKPSAKPRTPAPEGVDPAAFRRLLDAWGSDVARNVMEIDRAANDTSVVFELEWRGWRLLFPGDAEQRSWKTMAGRLRPVDVLKVAHHGSHNATPPEPILSKLFPERKAGERRIAIVSTCVDTYPGVPDGDTMSRISAHCDEVHSTEDVEPGLPLEVRLSPRR